MDSKNLMDILAQQVMGTPDKGRDDSQPAMLSHGEYVIPADVVAAIGDGNTEAGFEALDRFIATIRKNYRGTEYGPSDQQALKGQPNAPANRPKGSAQRGAP